jgi:anti-sigma B factor antagonist
MDIGESRVGNFLVLQPLGRIDSSTSPEFNTKLLQAVGAVSGGVIVDFAAIDYISSAGLRSLMTAIRQRKDRRVSVAALRPVIEEIFRIARFQHVIPIFRSVDAAVSAWDASAQSAEPAQEATGQAPA